MLSTTFQFIKNNSGSCLSWAVTFAWLLFIFYKIQKGIMPINLNEFGDFIAGAFAPLAFFWLVRGYYQQGEELRQNTQALKMQGEELANSVLQQQYIVELTKEELQITKKELDQQSKLRKRLAQPSFHFNDSMTHFSPHLRTLPEVIELKFDFYNSRTIARNVSFYPMNEDLIFQKNYYEIIETGGSNQDLNHLELSVKFKSDAFNLDVDPIYQCEFLISFIDNEGELTKWDYIIKIRHKIDHLGTIIRGQIIDIKD